MPDKRDGNEKYLSIKTRNLCVSVHAHACVCTCVHVCVCSSNISADQAQTDLRFSTWLLRGLRVCNIGFVWTTKMLLINVCIHDLRIPLALPTIAMCDQSQSLQSPSRGHIPAAARAGPGLCRQFGPVLWIYTGVN